MRDILVTLLVLGILPMAVRQPWIGVMLWTWISIMNPHRLTWGFAHDAPFAALAAGATLLALLITKDKIKFPRTTVVWVLLAFNFWMMLTTVFAMAPGESLDQLKKVFKIQLMTFVALAVLHERKHIQIFMWVNAASLGFFGFKGGIHTLLGGGKVWGPGGFIGGNNEIGLAMLIAIPLLYYLYLTSHKRWVKVGLITAMVLSAIAVLGTQSRGAFLGIIAMGAVLWWRAPRKLMSGILISLAALVAVAALSEQITKRIETIETYEEDTSAMGRIYAWKTAVNIANSRPLGAGYAMYSDAVFNRYSPGVRFETDVGDKAYMARAAHSIYFQVLGEHGWIGLFLYLGIWLLTWRGANQLRRQSRGEPEFQWVHSLAGMCQVALVGYAVGGAFLSLAYFDLPYNIMVLIVVTQRWMQLQLAARAAVPAAGSVALRAPAGVVVREPRA